MNGRRQSTPAPRAAVEPQLALDSVLRVLRPLVRLLIRSGVTYPAFAAAAKRVFLEAARAELQRDGQALTDSAVTLLSGVHRRDVRTLTRGEPVPQSEDHRPLNQCAEVTARWRSLGDWLGADQVPRVLSRPEFDALVTSVSRDVRPRAMLDALLRLGAVTEADDGAVALAQSDFAPRPGQAEAAWVLADNLHDHAAAAAANLQGEANFLEQAVFVDAISADSALALQALVKTHWRSVHQALVREAQARCDADAARLPEQRGHRARIGLYVYFEPEEPT